MSTEETPYNMSTESCSAKLFTSSHDVSQQQKSKVYRTDRSASRKQKNPRIKRKTDWHAKFCMMVCNGDNDKAAELISQYEELNKNIKTRDQAKEMISNFISLGCKEDLCRSVFKIGGTKYMNIRDGKLPAKSKGGRNFAAFGSEDLEHLNEFVYKGVPIQGGEVCIHRPQLIYCTDENITSMDMLYHQYYLPFEPTSVKRKMGMSSFKDHMRAHHPEFRLSRVWGDACEMCKESQAIDLDTHFST